MVAAEHRPRVSWKMWSLAAALATLSAAAIFALCCRPNSRQVDYAFVEKLKSAKHAKSDTPAPSATPWIAKNFGVKAAALNAFGLELRDVEGAAVGYPDHIFHLLAHFEFGEILWVDQWTNFPVKLPPSPNQFFNVAPRRKAVKAFLSAIHTSGGCLIKAGRNRYLVAKVAEREKYEAAIRELGWLKGRQPPWAEPDGAASRSQPVGSEAIQTSAAGGSSR